MHSGCHIFLKLLLCSWKICFRRTFSKVTACLISICTEIFCLDAITHSSFFPGCKHSGCIPLDGYRESSSAGSRNMQLLVSRENLSGIFVFSLQVHFLTVWYSWASQTKKSCSVGLENCLIRHCSKSNMMIRLILVSFSADVMAPVNCSYQTRCGLAQITLHYVLP